MSRKKSIYSHCPAGPYPVLLIAPCKDGAWLYASYFCEEPSSRGSDCILILSD